MFPTLSVCDPAPHKPAPTSSDAPSKHGPLVEASTVCHLTHVLDLGSVFTLTVPPPPDQHTTRAQLRVDLSPPPTTHASSLAPSCATDPSKLVAAHMWPLTHAYTSEIHR